MSLKIFKKTVSDRLKKALIVGAALFTLGGAQEAKAQGLLNKIANTIENVNHVINEKLLIPTANIKHQVGRLERNIGRLDSNTGGLVSGTANAIAIKRAENAVRKQVQQNGTYYASVQDFSQATYKNETSNSAYLNEVKSKLNKNSKESRSMVQQKTTQQVKKSTTQRQASSQDVQKVLDILTYGGRK